MNSGWKADPATPRKAALILSGAAGKGPFAAGALSVVARLVEERRLEITRVVGTSSGALNAAVFTAGLRVGRAPFAADLLAELWKERATALRILTFGQRKRVVKDALRKFIPGVDTGPDFTPGRAACPHVKLRMALTTLDGREELSARHFYTTYERTKIFTSSHFTTEAGIDDIAGHAVASAAIPFVFRPVSMDGTTYVDGGVVDNAPLAWALHEDEAIETIVVVTSDPRVEERPLFVTRFPLVSVVNVVLRERLTRDLLEAHSFNAELKKLAGLGVDMKAVRKALQWRELDIVEIRPQRKTAGGFVSGFFSRCERVRNLNAGTAAAAAALDGWLQCPAAPSPPPLGPAETAQSQHLRRSSEILLIAPIKAGLVPGVPRTITYTARLQMLLDGLFALRQAGVERFAGVNDLVGPLETVTSLHFVQWAIIDQGTRLVLAVTFEGPWEAYIRGIVDNAGPFLDVIFCHCEGYSGGPYRHSTADGYDGFARWVRQHQQKVSFFHAAAPDMTANDVAWLRALAAMRAASPASAFAAAATGLSIPQPPDGGTADKTTFLEALVAFFTLRPYFAGLDAAFLERAAATQLALLNPRVTPPGRSEDFLAVDGQPAAPYVMPGATEDAWNWFKAKLVPLQKGGTPDRPEVTLEDPGTVQGNILTGYARMVDGLIVFLQFANAAAGADFVGGFRATVERSTESLTKNIALTYAGFQALGLGDLADFPQEFRDGMERRAPMLGDVGVNHPYFWQRPAAVAGSGTGSPRVDLSTIDAVVIYQSQLRGDPALDRLRKELDALAPGVRVLAVQDLSRPDPPPGPYVVEPFGFSDGISQPSPLAHGYGGLKRDKVALGELLLGYANAKGENPSFTAPAIFRNGSYLAMRKLKQDVAAWDDYVNAEAGAGGAGGPSTSRPSSVELFKAKIMGREPSGRPLALGWSGPDLNDFDYESDPKGAGCPLAAHVRRANPRVERTPRILRRGFGYDEGGGDRGLVFIACCASLGAQYEVVQKWVNGANSTGTYGAQVDPTAAVPGLSDPAYLFLDASGANAEAPMPATPLVSLQWGLYLFAPSTTGLAAIGQMALERIASKAAAPSCPFSGAAAGEAVLKQIDAMERRASLDRWREIVEENDPVAKQTGAAVFAALRARGAACPSSYGVLVSGEKANLEVLADSKKYSVSEYGRRMQRTFGLLYLGQDPEDGHDAAAPEPNEFIAGITRAVAYEAAFKIGAAALAQAPAINLTPGPPKPTPGRSPPAVPRSPPPVAKGARRLVDLGQWGDMVLCELVERWFGFPDEALMRKGGTAELSGAVACCPDDFRAVSAYIFGPQPTEACTDAALARGPVIAKAGAAFVEARRAAKPPSTGRPTLVDSLIAGRYMGGDDDAIARTWIGAVNGFTVPTSENFELAMYSWLKDGRFWRIQQAYLALANKTAEALDERRAGSLAETLIQTMQQAAVPFVLHRRLKENGEVSPGVQATPEVPVALLLTSAGNELFARGSRASDVLFGGTYKAVKGPNAPAHACPGKEMALGVILGLAAAVFERNNVLAEGALAVSFDA